MIKSGFTFRYDLSPPGQCAHEVFETVNVQTARTHRKTGHLSVRQGAGAGIGSGAESAKPRKTGISYLACL